MITSIEALNYRCLRYISQALDSFHVLVGANASGKTTFLDVVSFMQDIAIDGLEIALTNRTSNPEELLFKKQGHLFELAIEAQIPEHLRKSISRSECDRARYEIAVGFDSTQGPFEFKNEKFLLKKKGGEKTYNGLFPASYAPPQTLLTRKGQRSVKVVFNKTPGGNDNFYSEVYSEAGKGWAPSFKLGPQKSALQNLPADEEAMPVATWFQELLRDGIQRFMLNSMLIRKPSPPTRIRGFLPDGSNLPWVVARLRKEAPEHYNNWIAHLQTALPDLTGITTVERPEDKHCYLVYEYTGNFRVPSWLVSDGTLRLTALTLPAYLTDFKGIYLIEEPENGIHPSAVSAVYDSLSSIYNAQVLLASHSPIVLNAASSKNILCFAKTDDGATDIVPGNEHPRLRTWRGEANLGTLLAAGVLG